MKILSVYPWTHISSSALMINGKIVSGAAEERFNKIKWSTEFPIKSAEWCLKQNNISCLRKRKPVIIWAFQVIFQPI